MNYCTFGDQVGITSQALATFNLSNGTVHFTTNATAKITDVGNGWYRCVVYPQITGGLFVIHPNISGNINTNLYGRSSYSGDGTSGVLIWGAMMTDDPLNEGDYIKTGSVETAAPRFTHERVETGNLIGHSETLGPGSGWNQSNLDVRQSYAIKSPSGEFDGTFIKSNTSNAFHNIIKNNLTVKSGKNYTLSAHFKLASGTNFGCLRLFDGANYIARASFTLTGSGSVSVNNGFNGEITALEDGWYRCSITGTSTTNSSAAFISLDINSIFVHNGLGHSLYVWGAQFEQASGASTYVPSIDTFTSRASNATYVDSAGLVKTSYVNQLVYSNDFTSWNNAGNALTVGGTVTAPDGTQTATKVVVNNGTNNNAVLYQSAATGGALSVYAKADGMTHVNLLLQNNSYPNSSPGAQFDLINGTVTFTANATGEMIDEGNGWWRCIMKPISSTEAFAG